MNFMLPCSGRPKGWWNDEEADIIDILLHLSQPELVVESGTQFGYSSLAFLHHAKRVITIDPEPRIPEGLFFGKPITQVIGKSPDDLEEKVSSLIKLNERWVFFHDGLHTGKVLLGETEWAFRHGALLVFWHDAGKREGNWEIDGTMPQAIDWLRERGNHAIRISDSGNPGTTEAGWTGIGMAWPNYKKS